MQMDALQIRRVARFLNNVLDAKTKQTNKTTNIICLVLQNTLQR